MSVASDMKKLREMLGAANNAQVLDMVRALQEPMSRPITLAVTWTPGAPELEAIINVLSGKQVPFQALSATLRAGLAVLDWQLAQRTQQLQAQLQQAMTKREVNEKE